MKILILGAGKMGTFFCDILSFDHEVAIFDIDPKRLRFTYNTLRFTQIEEIKDFEPELVINAATVKYTISMIRAIRNVISRQSDKVCFDLIGIFVGCMCAVCIAMRIRYMHNGKQSLIALFHAVGSCFYGKLCVG